MAEPTPVPNQGDTLQLNCLIEGEPTVFVVPVGRNNVVSNLKKLIQSERVLDSLKDVGPHTLELWKPKDSNPIAAEPEDTLVDRIGFLGHDLSNFADKLGPSRTVFSIFPTQSPRDYIHIIVKVPRTALKRKRDDPTDISRKLFDLWTKPVALDLQHLKEYFEKPLDPDWKIPLSYNQWKEYLASELSPAQACSDKDLESLFKQSEDETAVAILDLLKSAITRDPVNPSGTEISLVSFWDRNIRDILERCIGVASIRDSNQGTETGKLQPDFGLLLSNVCVFRGEEKRIDFGGAHPRDELKHKTRWVYDPAPYILGYYAIGMEVVLVVIVQPRAEGLRVVDLISADLSSRRERIKNAVRMIKLCGILKRHQQVIGEGKDRDMRLQPRDGGKSIEYFSSNVRKSYGLQDKDDGKERVERLMAIYASLVSKGS
ncbi:hypothetical protein APHAL10511_002234 [Amanita phalloides]|nr:hypothetical protein APHAL10511_002234 [Amanita phalloides]